MRLSEAMRLGSMIKPQGFGGLITDGGRKTCAMGAACEAVGIDLLAACKLPPHEGSALLRTTYASQGWRVYERAACPQCGLIESYLPITHLNDKHHWTRERIADFVESIESQQPVKAPPVEVACE